MDILIAITVWLLIGVCAVTLSAALVVVRGGRWRRDPLRLRGIAFAQGQLLRLLAKAIVTRIADASDSSGKD
ncbi:MAG: hypothetical protein NTV86_14180 [Planctomycetota bacterium]|nr:hypothetical protein [Planctomycetota bacterium]